MANERLTGFLRKTGIEFRDLMSVQTLMMQDSQKNLGPIEHRSTNFGDSTIVYRSGGVVR